MSVARTAPPVARSWVRRAPAPTGGRGWRRPALLVALGVLVVLGRGATHLLHPTFWAEDGSIFYSQARLLGLPAVWTPYAGYLHLLPRVAELPVQVLPLSLAPAGTVWLATALDLALVATVLSPRLGWLIPSASSRAGLFVLVLLLPDQYETLTNLANLIFVGGIALAALALSDPPRSRAGRVAEVAAVIVLGLSGPIVLLLVPLFAYRVARTRTAQSWVVGLAALGCGVTQLVVYLTSDRVGSQGGGTVGVLAEVVIGRGPGGWVFGPRWSMQVVDHPGVLRLLVVVPVLWLLLAVTVVGLTRGWAFTAVVTLTVGLLFGAATWAYGVRMLAALGSNRHVVVPMALCLVALVAAASTRHHPDPARPPRRTRRAALVAAGLLAVGVLGVTSLFRLQPWPQPTDTGGLTRCLASPAPVCAAPISPSGHDWRVVVRGTPPR